MVLRLERVTPALRGELTRWLLEPAAGVFVGNVSAMVREQLWDLVNKRRKGGAAVLVYSADTEQGFAMAVVGTPAREIVDFEGLLLVRTRRPVSVKGQT